MTVRSGKFGGGGDFPTARCGNNDQQGNTFVIHCGSGAASGNETRISKVATIRPLEQVPGVGGPNPEFSQHQGTGLHLLGRLLSKRYGGLVGS